MLLRSVCSLLSPNEKQLTYEQHAALVGDITVQSTELNRLTEGKELDSKGRSRHHEKQRQYVPLYEIIGARSTLYLEARSAFPQEWVASACTPGNSRGLPQSQVSKGTKGRVKHK